VPDAVIHLGCERFCLGCQPCKKYQDVAVVGLPRGTDIDLFAWLVWSDIGK